MNVSFIFGKIHMIVKNLLAGGYLVTATDGTLEIRCLGEQGCRSPNKHRLLPLKATVKLTSISPNGLLDALGIFLS